MGFMAAAIPIAGAVLGALSKDSGGQPQQAVQPPPGLGEIFAMNSRNYQQQPVQAPVMSTAQTFNVGSK